MRSRKIIGWSFCIGMALLQQYFFNDHTGADAFLAASFVIAALPE